MITTRCVANLNTSIEKLKQLLSDNKRDVHVLNAEMQSLKKEIGIMKSERKQRWKLNMNDYKAAKNECTVYRKAEEISIEKAKLISAKAKQRLKNGRSSSLKNSTDLSNSSKTKST